jgi:hypothetical protein
LRLYLQPSKVEIENFFFGPPFGFQVNDEKFSKIILWYPLSKIFNIGTSNGPQRRFEKHCN